MHKNSAWLSPVERFFTMVNGSCYHAAITPAYIVLNQPTLKPLVGSFPKIRSLMKANLLHNDAVACYY